MQALNLPTVARRRRIIIGRRRIVAGRRRVIARRRRIIRRRRCGVHPWRRCVIRRGQKPADDASDDPGPKSNSWSGARPIPVPSARLRRSDACCQQQAGQGQQENFLLHTLYPRTSCPCFRLRPWGGACLKDKHERPIDQDGLGGPATRRSTAATRVTF